MKCCNSETRGNARSALRMPAMRVLPGLAIAVFLTAAPTRADDAAPTLPKLDYRYAASWGGLGVGDVEVHLQPDDKAGCYRYNSVSKPIGLVRALYGAPNQLSRFCIEAGSLKTKHFESNLPSDASQTYTLDFDWSKHTVTDDKGRSRDIPDDAIDSFALQQAVRLWVLAHAADKEPPVAAFTMVDANNLTHYQFKLAAHERIETPAGSMDTIRLDRVDNPDKSGHFWLAPDKDYMPVVIETRNGNKPVVRMELKP